MLKIIVYYVVFFIFICHKLCNIRKTRSDPENVQK